MAVPILHDAKTGAEDGILPCLIWERRPVICQRFPTKPQEVAGFLMCTFRFDEKGERHGSCELKGCRTHCCVNMTILGKKHAVCPFYHEA